jgi:hypothetical protein
MKKVRKIELYDKDGNRITKDGKIDISKIHIEPMSEEQKREFFKGKKRVTLNFADLEPIPDEIRIPCPFGQTKN